jgi:adenine-specific DNA glycosylase
VELRWLAVIAEDPAGRWLLHRVDSGPILRGLWLPPLVEINPSSEFDAHAADLLPFPIDQPLERLESTRHSITHRRIVVVPVRVVVEDPPELSDGWRWVDPLSPGLPTSSLLGKLVRAVSP